MPSRIRYPLLIATLSFAAAWNAAGQGKTSIGARPNPTATPVPVSPLPPEFEDHCKTIFLQIRQRIEDALKTKGLPPMTDADGPVEFLPDINDPYGRRVMSMSSGRGFSVRLGIGPPPGYAPEILSVTRPSLDNVINTSLLSTLPKEQMEQLGRFWCEAVLGSFPARTGKVSSYNQPGSWFVFWPRVDSRGYPFENDSLRCRVNDQYGIIEVTNDIRSVSPEKQKIALTNVEAIEAARADAHKLMAEIAARLRKSSSGPGGIASWSSWEDWKEWWDRMSKSFHGYSVNVLGKPRLLIVNPPRAASVMDGFDYWGHGDNTARLVWEVYIDIDNVPAMGLGYGYHRVHLSFWIDTETGEFLGGHAVSP